MRTRVYLGILILLAFVALLSLPAHAQLTTITATNIESSDGLPLALGTMCWTGTNNAGTPISYRAGSSGQTVTTPVCRDIINGAVQATYKGVTISALKVADSTLTTPANVCYKVTVVDSSSGKVVLGSYAGAKSGYDCVQPSGATWSFDTYTPAGTPNVVQVAGPTGPQGAPGLTFNASSNIPFTGNNTHTGTEDFRSLNNVYLTGPAIDSGVYADECAAIAAAVPYAQAKGWTSVHVISGWKGTQTCANSPFAGFPFTPGSAATFSMTLDLERDNLVLTPVPWVVPGDVSVNGGSNNVIGCGVGCGFTLQPTNTFSGTAVIEYGAATTFAGSNPPEGIKVDGVNVNCKAPNGTRPASIGIRNQFAQNHSSATHYGITNCPAGLVIDNNGGPSNTGAENGGTYGPGSIQLNAQLNTDIGIAVGQNSLFQVFASGAFTGRTIIQSGATAQRTVSDAVTNGTTTITSATANFTTADIGSVLSGTNITSGTRILSVTNSTTVVATIAATASGSGGSLTIKVQPNVGMAFDTKWGAQRISDFHFEGFKKFIQFAAVSGAQSVEADNIDGTGLAGGLNVDAVIDISSANAASTSAITLMNIRCGGICTDILFDHNTNGGEIPGFSQFNGLSLYIREQNNVVFSSRPEIPTTMLGALTATATQSTSLISLAGNASNTNTINLLNIVANGANERPFFAQTASATGSTTTYSAATNLWITAPKVNATSGANVSSFGWQTSANCWNGSVSVAHTGYWRLVPASGTNPSVTLQWVKGGGCGGADVFDTTNFTRVLANNIRSNTASNSDLDGQITLASGTGSYTFAGTYTSAPICVATDTTAATAVKVTVTTTTLTLTGTGTDVIDYICHGRN